MDIVSEQSPTMHIDTITPLPSPPKPLFKTFLPIIGLLLLPIIIGAVKFQQDIRSKAAIPAVKSVTTAVKPSLIFSLDQSFGNGIVHQQDIEGLNRVISSLKVFQKYYSTYALLNPMNLDPRKLEGVLDLLEQSSIPFVLDVYASDVLTIASGNTSVASPSDLSHGISLALDRLQNYKNRYGQFKGVRIFEISSLDYTLRTCRSGHPEWCESRWFTQAASPFFDENIAKSFVQFANNNGLFVLWSDWHWNTFDSWDTPLGQQEQSLTSIIQQYPNTIIPMYNNNEPGGKSRAHVSDWFSSVNKFSQSAGFGLSDQAWLCDADHMNCPISDLISWANSAISQQAKIIQFEPVWYFFNFPEGIVWDPNNYTTDQKWINRGYPTDNLTSLARGLNISDALPTYFTGQYFNNKNLLDNPVLTRTDSAINFDWGLNSPASNLPKDNFSVRWTKNENFTAGTYQFSMTSNDGSRLYVDGRKYIDYWSNHLAKTKIVDINLTAGQHVVVMDYYENTGLAVAKLTWTKR